MKMSLSRDNTRIFGVLFALFFLKNMLFHWLAFNEWLPANEMGLWAAAGWLLPKIGSALLIASLAFLMKRKRWMLVVALAVDTWCIANLIYMRNNNYLLDSFAFNIAGNLNGYWWSTLLFIEWAVDLGLYAISLLTCLLLIRPKQAERSFGAFC